MAEGLLRAKAGDRFEVFSAGTRPGALRAEAVAALRELGIDISHHRSKSVDEFAGQHFDYVITVCDDARESCPVFPAGARRIHWSFEDPVTLADFQRVRDEIGERLDTFLRQPS
jgi:arsenate reductase